MYAQEEPCGAGLRPTGTISLEEHRVGGTEISHLIRTPSSQCSLSRLAGTLLNKLWLSAPDSSTKRPSAYTIWLEDSQVSKFWPKGTSTSEAVRTRNRLPSSIITAQSSPPTTKGIPRVTSRDDDARDSFKPGKEMKQQDLRSPQLKASIKQNLYFAGTGRTNL